MQPSRATSHPRGHAGVLHTTLAPYTCRLNDSRRRAHSSPRQPVQHKASPLQRVKLLGCIGDWNPASQTGNPMHSVQVRSLLKGYNNHAAELGYQRKGAVPLTDSEMLCLLQSMATTCSNSNTDQHQQLLLLRDGMLFSLLWQSCFRGFNAGALRLENILLPTGESAVPYLVPEVKLPAGAILHLLPDTTQNKRGGPGALQNHLVLRCSVLLLLAADGCALLCCSRPAYHRLHHQATSSGNQMLCRP